ncbi:hypothetical protein KSP40_PGU013692 [Platanthera guangdongensis]|uniref:Uncharacterized protein n=1 Tax=Platanthera guangdongensis TaxID=2320717 RepID=A0ABR2N399_9ASPA
MIPNAKKFRFGGIAPELEEKLDKMFSLVVATGENVWMPSSGELPGIFSHANTLSEEAEDNINESNNTQTFANEDLDSTTPEAGVLKVVQLQNENERGRDMKWGQNRLCWHMWKSYSPPQKQLCSALQHQLFPLVYICCERRFKNWRSTQKSLRTGCCIILLQFIFKHP